MEITPDSLFTTFTYCPTYKWRKKVKELNNYKCLYCGEQFGEQYRGRGVRLESHHIFKTSLYPELSNILENGVCLCSYCHREAHGNNYAQTSIEAHDEKDKNTVCYDIEKTILEYVKSSILLLMPAGKYNAIKAHAKRHGESVNGFINRAIDEAMERDRRENDG